jgi:hypothetical protein
LRDLAELGDEVVGRRAAAHAHHAAGGTMLDRARRHARFISSWFIDASDSDSEA